MVREAIEGKTVFSVDGNLPAACFDTGITEELVKVLARRNPLRAVFRDYSYGSDSVKINVEQIFKLGWSHYVTLQTIRSAEERKSYEIKAMENNWSVRELQRQIGASLYERLALSRDKEKIQELSEKGQLIETPDDVLKNPYVLEFLNLPEHSHYSEHELETAIIDKIEHFLLELGKGFLFEARQKRFTFEDDHFYVDLVFYNRLLRCYILKNDRIML
ncbi:MAG: DUF1016 family protein [Candidatus Scalindua sp. AMX11]|nr:MAG: DUF1016 family protein [Candidatus Scalindua sp.]NOG85717.1 YhcG family protein [Planctomycetota bacterium]RZV73204.1 MAG: DUF1016 family protein [Candidatus Scalindua sp. SCAELEC01]TDE64765.1 MAG: DUF1016 family protein [Candidatus Scalindua sp. AMX11]